MRAYRTVRQLGDGARILADQIMSFSVSQRMMGQPAKTGSQHVSTR
jgi:hypothetical protein